MTRLLLAALALTVVAVLAPAALLAKGASEAVITGPGIEPIALTGSGEPGSGEQLGQIAAAAGFFPTVFGGGPDAQQPLEDRPEGTLGPRYTITYTMPGPRNETDMLVQEVYPYAKPEAVTYTRPGQRFWTTERTQGGWYLSSWYLAASLKELLVDAGLPASDPTAVGDGDGLPWTLLAVLAAAAVALAAVALAAIRIRRRPDAAPAR